MKKQIYTYIAVAAVAAFFIGFLIAGSVTTGYAVEDEKLGFFERLFTKTQVQEQIQEKVQAEFGEKGLQYACCERTLSDSWCAFEEVNQCDPSYSSAYTSCSQTSYCQLGTCMDLVSGGCMENTPKTVCENNGGSWDEREEEEISSCQKGCCILGTQAFFS